MLVLSRRQRERIMIGDTIVVEVIEIRGDVAKIGITAPADVAVHREEVFLRIAGAVPRRLAPGRSGVGPILPRAI